MPGVLTTATTATAKLAPRNIHKAVSLADLPAGSTGIFSHADLSPEQTAYISAIGLTPQSTVRVCKGGQPCVVEVRSTRVGIARTLARQLFVAIPSTDSDSLLHAAALRA